MEASSRLYQKVIQHGGAEAIEEPGAWSCIRRLFLSNLRFLPSSVLKVF
jgi:hypothetical protein